MRTGGNLAGDAPGTVGLDPISGVFANRGWTCVDRYEHAFKHQRAFMSREVFAANQNCSNYFIYTTSIRDPMSRMISNYFFHKHNPGALDRWTSNNATLNECYRERAPALRRYGPTVPTKPGNSAGVRCGSATWPFIHGTLPYDNYYIRMFAGEEAFLKPLGGIDRGDLERAKRFLDAHQVVIILENFRLDFVQAEVSLGWTLPPDYTKDQRKTSHKYLEPIPRELHHRLLHMNTLDYEFFAYAKQRAKELTRRANKRSKHAVPSNLLMPMGR